jgi:hypothetical protein
MRQSKTGVLHADGDTGFACYCTRVFRIFICAKGEASFAKYCMARRWVRPGSLLISFPSLSFFNLSPCAGVA